MSVGDSYQIGTTSYVAMFPEASWGTYPATAATGATSFEATAVGIRTEVESNKIDSFGLTRGFTKRVQLGKNVTGNLDGYLSPHDTPLLFAVALGGGITSVSNTAAAFYTHSISAGNFDGTLTSLSFNIKKGDVPFGFTGGRINNLRISATVGEIVNVSAEFIFKDSTISITDINASLSISAQLPFTFVNGSYEYAASEASLTSTVAEKIQSFELVIGNNLKADASARALGTNLLTVLPPTRRDIQFSITQRWDTTTTFNRFIQATIGSVRLTFEGASITASQNYQTDIVLPKVYMNSTEPILSRPDDVLMSEITLDVVMDTTTSAGREIGVTVYNDVATY